MEKIRYKLEEIESVAQRLINIFGSNRIVAFDGKMGAGKTTLIKELCRQLGSTSDVSSPTFAIVNEYSIDQKQKIYHFDFYRLNKEQEALEIGLFDYLDSGNWCFIEWHEKIASYIPQETIIIKIEETSLKEREITYTL